MINGRFSLRDENLVVGYRVTNRLPHEIWICTTQSFFDGEDNPLSRDVRIVDGMLWIQRRAGLPQRVHGHGETYAGYHRLLPGQTRSDIIVLPRPVQWFSFLYSNPEEPAGVVLNRLVVQVGYFDEDLPSLVQRYSLQGEPRVCAMLKDCLGWHEKDPNAIMIPYLDQDKWDGRLHEKSVSLTISNVAIPAELGNRIYKEPWGEDARRDFRRTKEEWEWEQRGHPNRVLVRRKEILSEPNFFVSLPTFRPSVCNMPQEGFQGRPLS
jgi:hypothetical protein